MQLRWEIILNIFKMEIIFKSSGTIVIEQKVRRYPWQAATVWGRSGAILNSSVVSVLNSGGTRRRRRIKVLSTASPSSRLSQCDPGAWGLQRPTEATNRIEREEEEEVVGRKKKGGGGQTNAKEKKKGWEEEVKGGEEGEEKKEKKRELYNFVGTSWFRRLRSSLAPG